MGGVKTALSSPCAGIFITLVILILFFAIINPRFLSPINIGTMLRAMSYSGLIAIGMGLCLISGVIDLSVGSTAGLASIVFGIAIVNLQIPLVPAILIALAIGGIIGWVNSIIIIRFRITPFMGTISMMFAVRGLAIWSSKGFTIYPLGEYISRLGGETPLGVNWTFVALILVSALAWWLLDGTIFGLCIKATGSDYEVAKITEVNVKQVHTVLLILIGVLAAASGIALAFTLNAGTSQAGMGWEFLAITACAIGGVSLSGYEGSIFGIICGMATIQVLQNGIVMVGLSPYLQQVIVGGVLLLAIGWDVKRRTYLNLEKI